MPINERLLHTVTLLRVKSAWDVRHNFELFQVQTKITHRTTYTRKKLLNGNAIAVEYEIQSELSVYSDPQYNSGH